MMRATTDRGEIIHLAGFQRLSPALDEQSRPAFSAQPANGLRRCGWEAFFSAMRERGLAVEYDAGDPASPRLVPAGQARGGEERGRLGPAVGHARRFWKALFT